ncbi:ABC transporter substrate-binding protein [Roseomonas sp. SSH11]|uniref:ABC transporter substrate-binding protein n=1 Tax=Pararoseomonas baculiformis TaxID=2820812 RepID=A0ABS4AH32_9PROT|nr:ABC transporter substrate-binding protein [Pararoseomonas baculiformis]MBP0446339.1 ABC transporter substrate-binding protein [Pararoseomonas baculiformis]
MSGFGLTKRQLLSTGALALPALAGLPRVARAAGSITVVLESEVVVLDPHATTAAITRSFGYQIFDTLFAQDSNGTIRPQMAEGHTVSADGLNWRFTLRDGLAFHDGAPVTAADCVASLRRWASRDSLGRMLLAAMQEMRAEDARSFSIVLKEPFPLMLDVLGKPNAPVPFIMPARILPEGDGRITEIIGSGPFTFVRDQWRTGDRMVLRRNARYVPRAEPPDFLAGGKVVKIDELVLKTMPDDSTGANALSVGEIDYMQYLPFDFLGPLGRNRDVRLMGLKGIDMFQGNFRLNHASGPFADPAVRKVMWKLVDQKQVMDAIGIPAQFRVEHCPSFWMCDTPLETKAGGEVARLDIEGAKAELARTGYKGEPVIMLEVSGSISQTAAHVLAENMKKAGFTVDEQVMDWGTVLARRARPEGWGLFPVYANGVDMMSPLTHFYVANNCSDYPGRSCDARITTLLQEFVKAPDAAARKQVAEQIQVAAYDLTPSVIWGQFSRPAGYRTRLKNLIQSSFPMFWQVEV